MKKKIIFNLIVCLIVSSFFLTGCNASGTNIVRVNEIVISNENLYLSEGETTVISAQVYPINAFNQDVHWVSTNPDIVSIEDGFVVAKGEGEAIIKVISDDGAYEDNCNVLVTTTSDNLQKNDYYNEDIPLPEEYEKFEMPTDENSLGNGNQTDSTNDNLTTQNTTNILTTTATENQIEKILSLVYDLNIPYDCFNPKNVLPTFASSNIFSNFFNTQQKINQNLNNFSNTVKFVYDLIEPEDNTQVEKINGITYVVVFA